MHLSEGKNELRLPQTFIPGIHAKCQETPNYNQNHLSSAQISKAL